MGAFISKKSDSRSKMRACEDALQEDPDVQSFDTKIFARTTHVINTVVAGVGIQSLSFDSLKEITGGLLEPNQEVVKIVLENKKDIWNNRELFELVDEYFKNSLHLLDFCTALEKCLKRTHDRHLIMQVALQRFEEEDCDDVSIEQKYAKTLEELKRFKIAEDPFTVEFFQILGRVHHQQLSMLKMSSLCKGKINKKLKSLQTWRKLSGVIFISAIVAVVICSIVTAAVAAPPIAAALAAAASVPLGSIGKWFDTLWKRHQVDLERQGELISSMQVRTLVVVSDLDSIRVLVDRLEMQIESIVGNADFALRGEVAVKIGIQEIKKNLEMFMQSLEDLGGHADKCSDHITKGRTAILRRIMRYQE